MICSTYQDFPRKSQRIKNMLVRKYKDSTRIQNYLEIPTIQQIIVSKYKDSTRIQTYLGIPKIQEMYRPKTTKIPRIARSQDISFERLEKNRNSMPKMELLRISLNTSKTLESRSSQVTSQNVVCTTTESVLLFHTRVFDN